MNEDENPWKKRFERERQARKESEALLEEKSFELWRINQNLEKQVEERTKDLENALIHANKAHKAKSDFLANMSHEIRTPLNAIIGFAQYFTSSNNLNEKDYKYASIIEKSALSLLEIINDILDFSKIENGNFEISINSCNLYELSSNVTELFSQKIGEKYINFNFSFDENIPNQLLTDPIRIKQVLSNLLSNAIKFTPEEEDIALNIELIDKNDTNALILFEIIDTGIGIPKNKIGSVLNPFVQLENVINKQHTGTGLGLSICNNILKLLDSEIKIESEINKGSKFSFYLNCQIATELEEEVAIDIKKNNYSGLKVLLAEDNSANQELMKLLFEELELSIHIATNGNEVIEAYIEDTNFDIILMDINMPKLNGIEAFKKIRAFEEEYSLNNIPIIALTANAIKGDKERFQDLGMNGYLSKPINFDKLKELLSKYSKSI